MLNGGSADGKSSGGCRGLRKDRLTFGVGGLCGVDGLSGSNWIVGLDAEKILFRRLSIWDFSFDQYSDDIHFLLFYIFLSFIFISEK